MDNRTEFIIQEGEIRKLYESDQADRAAFAKNPSIGSEIYQRDKQRLQEARNILKGGDITDPHDLNMLAFIFQHGQEIQDYEKALELAIKSVEVGLPPENSLIPQATDRLMIQKQLDQGVAFNQLKQKYGTQVLFDSTGKPFTPSLDDTATKEDLQKFGLK